MRDDKRMDSMSQIESMLFLMEAMEHGGGNAIERAEARGQRSICAASRIPSDGPWSELEALGVKRGAVVDRIFHECTLPEGWALKPTDHSMWSTLVDASGKEVASVFFKAAPYDYSAFFRMTKPDPRP